VIAVETGIAPAALLQESPEMLSTLISVLEQKAEMMNG